MAGQSITSAVPANWDAEELRQLSGGGGDILSTKNGDAVTKYNPTPGARGVALTASHGAQQKAAGGFNRLPRRDQCSISRLRGRSLSPPVRVPSFRWRHRPACVASWA